MSSRRWLVVALAVTAILLLAGRAVATLFIDAQWFTALGAREVWRAETMTTLVLRGASALAGTVFVFANLFAVRLSVVSLIMPRRVGNIEIGEEVPGRYLMGIVIALSLLFGLLLALPHDHWTTAYLALIGEPFGETDPYLAVDIGFFVHWLPFEISLYVWALIALLLVSALVVFFYALTPSLRWERGTLHASNYVRRHLTILGALLMLLLAWSYRIDAYELLSKGHGEVEFTAVDHVVVLPGNLFLSWFTAVGAVLVLIFGWRRQMRAAFVTVTAVIMVALFVRQLAPVLVRRTGSPIDPVAREAPYRTTQQLYTRQAFATDSVQPVGAALGYSDLGSAARWVSLWDPGAIVRAVERADSAVGWRLAPTGLLGVVPRRPSPANEAGAASAPEWGAVRVIAFDADERGAIVSMRDAGASGTAGALPPVHVFPNAEGYHLVADSAGALAAPPLDDGVSRLAHAWSLQNFRLYFADLPHPRPTILRRRDVRERVRALAPIFEQSRSIVPAVHGDSLLWFIDLYTTSPYYPLSRHIGVGGREWSYFRHAATAIVNATSGRVTLVRTASPDPIAGKWMASFPRVFIDLSELDPELRTLLPPAVDGARAQATAFARVGNRRVAFPDLQLPYESGADSLLADGVEPLLAFPAAGAAALTIPVLDSADRVAGLVIATGGMGRGTYWMPLSQRGPRWGEALDRLREPVDTITARVDAPVVRGRIRALPVRDELVLLQPSYEIRGGVATLHSVAALDDDRVRTGATLAQALGIALDIPAEPIEAPLELRQRVAQLYDAMRAALRRGDWTAFGAAFDSLGSVLAGAAP